MSLIYKINCFTEVDKPPAPLPDETGSTIGTQEQEEQTLNIIREDSAEAVTLSNFDDSSRRSSSARPESLTTRRLQFFYFINGTRVNILQLYCGHLNGQYTYK